MKIEKNSITESCGKKRTNYIYDELHIFKWKVKVLKNMVKTRNVSGFIPVVDVMTQNDCQLAN